MRTTSLPLSRLLLLAVLALLLTPSDALAQQARFNAPQGYDRASGLQPEGAAADARVLPTTPMSVLRGGLAEGFDDITTLPDNGWALQNNSAPLGTTSWFQGNPDVFPSQSGDPAAYIGANFNNTAGTGTISNWLLTPELPLDNGTEMTFYARAADAGFPDRLQVRLSTAGASTDVGTAATDVGDFTELLLDINPTYQDGVFVNEWTEYTVTVSGLDAPTTGRFAFRYFVESGGPSGSNSDFIGLDEVSVGMGGGGDPELAYSPSTLSFDVPSGGSDTETVTISNEGDADLTYTFPGFAARRQIAELLSRGVNVNSRRFEANVEAAKGAESRIYAREQSSMAQYRVAGPDAFGYVAIDSNEEGGPAYDFIDISGTGTQLVAEDFINAAGCTFDVLDEGNALIDLPFSFPFYGSSFSAINVNANGLLVFEIVGENPGCFFGNDVIPDASQPNGGLIAPLWDDFDLRLNTDESSSGEVYYQDMGDGRFIVQFSSVEPFGTGNDGVESTFQAILYENGSIKYQYGTIAEGLSASIGIENADGTVGLQVSRNEVYAADGLAVLITQSGQFITDVSPASGTIAPGGSEMVSVTVDAGAPPFAGGGGLPDGTYSDILVLNSNDSDEGTVFIPAAIEVGGSGPSTIAAARTMGAGATVTLQGTVSRAKGAFAYFQDETAGLAIRQTTGAFFDAVADGTITEGTEIQVTGTLSEFRQLLQINGADLTSFEVLSQGNEVVAQSVTLQELIDNGEAYEAELVNVTGLTSEAMGTFTAATSYDATDATATLVDGLRIPNADDSDVDGTEAPAGAFTFNGVIGQFNFDDPAAGYQLLAIEETDIQEAGSGGIALPITFEDDIDYELTDFGGNMSMLVADPENESNTVVQSIRTADAECFAGTTVAENSGFTEPLPFEPGMTTMTVRVWSPEAGTRVRLKVEEVGNPTVSVETDEFTTVAMEWETLVFDFADEVPGTAEINFDATYNKASIFFNFQCGVGDEDLPELTYYWDDVTFGAPVEPGAIEFEPSPLVEMLESGATGTETVTITNNSDTDVAFDFSQYSSDEPPPPGTVAPASEGRFGYLALAKDEVDTRRGDGQSFGEGGPDAFGYRWIDSNEPGGPTFDWVDISGTGTALVLGDDEGVAVDLPFTFSFYGNEQDAVTISSNGYLTFGGAGAAFTNDPIPTPGGADDNIVAPFWDDLDPGDGNGTVYYQDMGDGRFIVQYQGVPDFPGPGEGTENTFEVILNSNGSMLFQYADMNGDLVGNTVGIENADGTDGLQIAFNEAYVENGLAVLIQRRPQFVTDVDPATGTIPAGGSVDVDVTFDATGLIAGTYEGALVVETDLEADPSTFELPVLLEVSGMSACAITAETITFDATIVGTSSSEDATVTNGGTAACELTAASADGPFAVEDFDPITLSPGESTTFSVVYSPTEAGDDTGTLTVNTSEGDLTAALAGSGLDEPTPEVSVESLTFNVPVGGMDSQTFTISNVGGENAADLEFDIAVAEALTAGGTVARTSTQRTLGKAGTDARRLVEGISRADGSTDARPYVELDHGPRAYYRNGGIQITHNESQVITDLTGIACSSAGSTTQNSYWRVFDLEEFGLTSGLVTSSVDIGIETANIFAAPPVSTVRLYTLDGPFVTANLTLVAEATYTINDSDDLVIVNVPIVGEFAAGDVLVVEWDVPNLQDSGSGVFFGANTEGQTGPTYVSAETCGLTEPTDLASIGFPDVAWVLNVNGEAGLSLLSVEPDFGVVAPGDDQEITATVDATDTEPGTYEFELVISTNDPSTPTVTVPVTINVGINPANEDDAVPTVFALRAAYPNPFVASTTIEYDLPEATHVTIEVYDAVGRRVATLVDAEQAIGRYEAVWNARSLASGVYLYRIQAGSFTKTLKMSLVR